MKRLTIELTDSAYDELTTLADALQVSKVEVLRKGCQLVHLVKDTKDQKLDIATVSKDGTIVERVRVLL